MEEITIAKLEVRLVACTPNPLDVIEESCRLSHDSKSTSLQRQEALIRGVVKAGHHSVLEHASATFLLEGVSRALTHQLVRHRIASYTQRSQRYVDEGEASFVFPSSIEHIQGAESIFRSTLRHIQWGYTELRKLGVSGDHARYLLPNACATKISVTMNFRELRHFFSLRLDSHASQEIQEAARMMLKLIYPVAPVVFEDLAEAYNVRI